VAQSRHLRVLEGAGCFALGVCAVLAVQLPAGCNRRRQGRVDALVRHAEAAVDFLMLTPDNPARPVLDRACAQAAERGVMPDEAAAALAGFRLMTQGLTAEERETLWLAMLEHRESTSIPLADLAPAYAKTAVIYRGAISPERVQDLVFATIRKSGLPPRETVRAFPGILATAKACGCKADQAGALFAAQTHFYGTAEEAVAAFRGVVKALAKRR